jgi:F0F1-type ATP synthase membrane subunit c/vacuolar-type H+-ATPase subunit K
MKKTLIFGGLAFMALAAVAEPTMAQEHTSGGSWFFPGGDVTKAFGVAIGMGLMVMGAAKGIGNIGANAVQSIARQPEAGDRIFTSMLLSAALIEGFTFFALLIQFTL